MEQKPNKKDELMLANNVLKLAADLLKVSYCTIIPTKVSFVFIARISFFFSGVRKSFQDIWTIRQPVSLQFNKSGGSLCTVGRPLRNVRLQTKTTQNQDTMMKERSSVITLAVLFCSSFVFTSTYSICS